MVSEELERQFKNIVDIWLKPYMKDHSFKFRSRIFIRDEGEVTWLLDIQRSRWNSQNEIDFCINYGFFVPNFWSIFSKIPDPKNPKVPDCYLNRRLEGRSKNQWWRVSGKDVAERDRIGEEIVSLLKEQAIPFFIKFKSIKEIVLFLEENTLKESGLSPYRDENAKLEYMAVLYFIINEKKRCKEIIEWLIKIQSQKYTIHKPLLELLTRASV